LCVVSAICSQFPDYAMVLISAAEGVTETTRQHFHLAFTLKGAVIVIVTKIDLIDEENLFKIRDQVKTLLKGPSISRLNIVCKDCEDVTTAAKSFGENIVPILFISTRPDKA